MQDLEALRSLHRESYPALTRGVVPPTPLPWFEVLLADAEDDVRSSGRTLTRRTRAEAREMAERRALELLTLAKERRAEEQRDLDQQYEAAVGVDDVDLWTALETVLAEVDGRPTVANVEYGEASLHLVVDLDDWLPPDPERATLTRDLLAGLALRTARQAQAAVPGVVATDVKVDSARGEVHLAASLTREALEAADWDQDPWPVLAAADPAHRMRLHRRAAAQPATA